MTPGHDDITVNSIKSYVGQYDLCVTCGGSEYTISVRVIWFWPLGFLFYTLQNAGINTHCV